MDDNKNIITPAGSMLPTGLDGVLAAQAYPDISMDKLSIAHLANAIAAFEINAFTLNTHLPINLALTKKIYSHKQAILLQGKPV